MINKFKNIAYRGISLGLAISMMIPSPVFAMGETDKWADYKDKLKSQIKNQNSVISINFGDGIKYASEWMAIQATTEAYNNAVKEMPDNHEINIANSRQSPIIEIVNGSYLLKQVNYNISYYNNFSLINNELSPLYAEINTKQTYYEKIRTAYDYVIEELEYEINSENHNILTSLKEDKGVSPKAYAILFSIIMDKLGYENIIVTGTIKGNTDHAWNMVKVQGNWYHVDTKLGDVKYTDDDLDKYFLTSDKIMIGEGDVNNPYKHRWKYDEYPKADNRYDDSKSLQYEIKYIEDGISYLQNELVGVHGDEGIKAEIEKIQVYENMEVTKEKIEALKKEDIDNIKNDIGKHINAIETIIEKVEDIQGKAKGYRNSVDILLEIINKEDEVEVNELSSRLGGVEQILTDLTTKSEQVLNNLIKKEQEVIAKDQAINIEAENQKKAVIKAEKAVARAESSMKDKYIALAKEAVESIGLGDTRDSFNNRIVAMEKLVKVETIFERYLKDSSLGESLNEAIEGANNAIDQLEDGDIKRQRRDRMTLISNAKEAVESAKDSLRNKETTSKENIEGVSKAEEAVLKLPYSNLKRELQNSIKDLSKAIKAKEAVENAEYKMDNNILGSKDITGAEKAISNVNLIEYIPGLKDRVEVLKNILLEREAVQLFNKAKEAIKNAEETKAAKDIAAAKKAVEAISNKNKYRTEIANIMTRIKAMESYLVTIQALEKAEKYKNEENKNIANLAFDDFKKVTDDIKLIDESVYEEIYRPMIKDITSRIIAIENYLTDEAGKVAAAEAAIDKVEKAMTVDSNPTNEEIKEAQEAVNKVINIKLKTELQKRINAIQIVKDAKLAVTRAKAYPNEKSVKEAEAALGKVDGRYSKIIESLSGELANLRNQLNISKKVEEATSLVQKAVETRKETDIIKAQFAVDALKELAPDSYKSLSTILSNLKESIGKEATEEGNALGDAEKAIAETYLAINKVNLFITGIIEGEDGELDKIKEAYNMVQAAKIQVINANAAIRKLSDKDLTKGLVSQMDYANKEIELVEDNIDVKEAVRLVTIASSTVLKAKTESEKSMAKLDIAGARRATDKINHNSNKAVKTTILNTINAVENKLTSDNDLELIDTAVDAVNAAANLLENAVRENKVIEQQEQIDKGIFAAKMAIGWISDNNKVGKATLMDFINDIVAMFEAEKEGIKNEERIKNAEKEVEKAQAKKGTDELDSYIRTARLRVKVIKNDSPETDIKIKELTSILDALEGKSTGGSGSGNGGGAGSGGNKPSESGNKPGGSGSSGNIVPINPIPDSSRVIGSVTPLRGDTKELKNLNPLTGLSIQDMVEYKILESKQKIKEFSILLNSMPNVNPKLVVRGKVINLDSKAFIEDKINKGILVPAKYLGDEIGFAVNLTDSPAIKGTKRLLIDGIVNGARKSIIMDLGSEYSYVDGAPIKLSSKPLIENGRAYIPIDLMVEHFGLGFSYSNENGNLLLLIN